MSNSFWENIFSVKNSDAHRVLTILGLKMKFFDSRRFLKHNPYGLIVDTTVKCNNNCDFCWRKNNPEYLKNILETYKNNHTMSFETYKKIIDNAVKYKSIIWLSLCGPMGEPLLNDHIEDFYEYAAKKNHFKWISLNTNGLAINKRDISRLLNSMDEFSISVDSIDPETYGKIHGSKDFLPVVIENIKSLIEYKKTNGCRAEIFVRFTENELNMGQYPEFEKFFKELGVDRLNYTRVHSFAGVVESRNDEQTAKKCEQPNNLINFDFKGNLATCCINWHLEPTFGNIKNKSIAQLWHGRKYRQWAKTFYTKDPCKHCSGLGKHVQKEGLLNKEEETV